MRRILFCSHIPTDPRLGVGKHWLELAQSFRDLGWESQVVGPDEIAGGTVKHDENIFHQRLREYLRKLGNSFDVVEYDLRFLPFPRTDFASSPLFVARCMLLPHHILETPLPPAPGFRAGLRYFLNAPRRRSQLQRLVERTNVTVQQADLTVVSNDRDVPVLIRSGARAERLRVFPLGLTTKRMAEFRKIPSSIPAKPVVGFVGTFDPRKGMREFPELVERIVREIPGVTFRLMGTAGLVRDEDGVRRYFPRRLWPSLEIHPRFEPKELPDLLRDVSVGVFPSRVEGFGYGVLEMLAAAVPVVAYDAPGPSMMLTPEFLCTIGDVTGLVSRIVELLADPIALENARLWARLRTEEFNWERIAKDTAQAYEDLLVCRSI